MSYEGPTAREIALPREGPTAPIVTIDADAESYPNNYEAGRLKATGLMPYPMPVHKGMKIYLTQNIRKATDFVNGMAAVVEHYDAATGGLTVITTTNYRNVIWPWTNSELPGRCRAYYPVRPGYASTILKFQGWEGKHVTAYLDAKGVPGAAYTAASRVRRGRDVLFAARGRLTRQHFKPVTI